MGRIPDLKRITKEDFPEKDRELVEKLAFPINSHMEQVRNLFNRNITFENLAQDLITITLQTGTDSKPLNNPEFKSSLNNRVRGIMVVSASITSNNTSFVNETPFISFSQDNDLVTITNISGLEAETAYELLLLTIS